MTDKKSMWGDSLLNLSFEELNELAKMVNTRQKVMADEIKLDKWNAVVVALKEYVDCFGAITVEGFDQDIYIDNESVFSSPGRIGSPY